VSNIGFGGTNTHTASDVYTKLSALPTEKLPLLKHNPHVSPNLQADYCTFSYFMFPSKLRIVWRIIASKIRFKPLL